MFFVALLSVRMFLLSLFVQGSLRIFEVFLGLLAWFVFFLSVLLQQSQLTWKSR